MISIIDILEQIRERPGIMLGNPCAQTLYAFLSGFALARTEVAPEDYQFLSAFGQWVRKRYQIGGSQGWAKIVEFQSVNPNEEMTLFWRLLDDFQAKTATRRKKVS